MRGHPVLTIKNPFPCRVIGRKNRFSVTIEHHGRRRQAWINNTGRLEQFLLPGTGAFCINRTPPGTMAWT